MKKYLLALLLSLGGTSVSASSEIFEFKAGKATWFVVNDGVMGGLSSSGVKVVDGLLEFSGRVRLENNGGPAVEFTVPRLDPILEPESAAARRRQALQLPVGNLERQRCTLSGRVWHHSRTMARAEFPLNVFQTYPLWSATQRSIFEQG